MLHCYELSINILFDFQFYHAQFELVIRVYWVKHTTDKRDKALSFKRDNERKYFVSIRFGFLCER